MESASECLNQIQNASHIAIITHQNADADALGSSIALKRLIKKNFETDDQKIDIDIFTESNEIAEQLKIMTKDEPINQQNFRRYDLAIALDCSDRKRLGAFDSIFKHSKTTLNIDHHETNDKFAKNNIVAPKCSSTCEIIYQLFVKVNHFTYSSDILSLLYSGIITDTNNLVQNIGTNTLKVVSDIMQHCQTNNVDLNTVRDYFFKNDKKERLSLLSRALESISFSPNEKIAMMKIVKQDFADTNTTVEDTIGIVNYAVNLQGVEVGIIFIKQDDNSYYVSLRSKSKVDVGKIAKEMNGGGHETVAAFMTKPEESLTDVKAKLISLCSKQLDVQEQNNVPIEDVFVEVKGEGPKDDTPDENLPTQTTNTVQTNLGTKQSTEQSKPSNNDDNQEKM